MTESGSGSIDPIMLELFRAEVDIHLPALSRGVLALEKGQADSKEIDSMMRAAHSIKGAARIVGNDPAVRVAHILEDCFTLAKDARVTLSSDSVDVLLEGVDALQRICTPDADVSEEFIQAVLERIASLRDRKPKAAKAPTKGAAELASSNGSVVLPANFDAAAAEAVRAQICSIFASAPATISFDFAAVNQLSVTAMALLLSVARSARSVQPSASIEAYHVAPPIRTLLKAMGLNTAFSVKD